MYHVNLALRKYLAASFRVSSSCVPVPFILHLSLSAISPQGRSCWPVRRERGIGAPYPDTQARQRLLDGLPEELQDSLQDLGERTTEPETLREAIRMLCSFGEWTKKNLALVLNRRPQHLAQKYLRPMIKEGILEYTIPETPKDRRQAYRTVPGHRLPTRPEADGDA